MISFGEGKRISFLVDNCQRITTLHKCNNSQIYSFPDNCFYMDTTNKIEALKNKWDDFSPVYSKFDSTPQTFYLTLINILKISHSKSILQIACGAGLLLPLALSMKQKEAQYVATDLSPTMVQKALARLQNQLSFFKSNQTLQDWMKSQNLTLKACNGQQPITGFGEFDTIICNLVLMLTDDPKKMLKSLHQTSTPNARIGATIWGDKTKSNFVSMVGRALKELNLPMPKDRSPFYLDEIIDQVAEESGWEVEFKWEQNAPFPFLTSQDLEEYISYQKSTMKDYSKEDCEKVGAKMREYFEEEVKHKKPMNFSVRLLVLRKKK